MVSLPASRHGSGIKAALSFAVLLAVLGPAMAEDSVVTGKMLDDKHLDHIDIACPENAICMHAWWRSVIAIRETIGGARPGAPWRSSPGGTQDSAQRFGSASACLC